MAAEPIAAPIRPRRRVAVVGAGWAGLAAAVRATGQGHAVTLFEMAAHAGGRARSVTHAGQTMDNGQHILIGAYRDTLALMRAVGVDLDRVLHRQALSLRYPDGSGLRLSAGAALPAFVRGVWAWRELRAGERLRLLALAAKWRLQGFQCAPGTTVSELARHCPPPAYRDLLEPLCVAALNTPAEQASAQVLLTVLRDALFSGPGSADLLLPRAPLDALFPAPALDWLGRHGATLQPGHRVMALAEAPGHVQVDGQVFDHLILATPPNEAARLLTQIAPAWSRTAGSFSYQPIVTAWIRSPGLTWPEPMTALRAGGRHPAQFAFHLGALGGPADTYALVISGAGRWVDEGAEAIRHALLAQWDAQFGRPVEWLGSRIEKRATFACTPALIRPDSRPHARISAAGDYVQGPYPATLEGAVRSGLAAVAAIA
jgi:squalene-associated FAD-dependent desaturase